MHPTGHETGPIVRRQLLLRHRRTIERSEQEVLDELGEHRPRPSWGKHPGDLANTAQDDASAEERCKGPATAALLVGLQGLVIAFEQAVLALEFLDPRRVSHDTR